MPKKLTVTFNQITANYAKSFLSLNLSENAIYQAEDLNLLVNADIKISCYYAMSKEMRVWIDVCSCILCLYLIFLLFAYI